MRCRFVVTLTTAHQRSRSTHRPPSLPLPTDLLKDNFDATGSNALKVVNKTANGVVS